MKILFIGGNRFVGLAMVREAISRGHEVSLFHRSDKVPAGTETAVHLKGDRTRDFTSLQTGTWDVVVDVCGYRPHEIHALYDVFAGRINRYVFVSTVSVYADDIAANSDETAKLADVNVLEGKDAITVPIDWQTYGPLKVLCEKAVEEHYPNNLIIRPTYVIGPDDYTNRFNFWVEKFMKNEKVEIPTNNQTDLQFVDVRDLAKFTVDAIDKDLTGRFHVCAESIKFNSAIDEIKKATNSQSEIALIDSADETKFPLWSNENIGVMAMNPARAIAAGLHNRPLFETITDIVKEIS